MALGARQHRGGHPATPGVTLLVGRCNRPEPDLVFPCRSRRASEPATWLRYALRSTGRSVPRRGTLPAVVEGSASTAREEAGRLEDSAGAAGRLSTRRAGSTL